MKSAYWLIITGFFLLSPYVYSQTSGMPRGMFQGMKEDLTALEKDNPKLFQFKERLADIEKEMQGIIKEYQQKRIDKEAAYQKLLPLVKEELEIKNNPEYVIEKTIHEKLRKQQTGPAGFIPAME